MQFRTEIIIHTNDTRNQGREYTNVADDVLSWTTAKQYGVPAGTWTIVLNTKPDEDGLTWFEKLSAQDFVRIRLAIGDGPFITVMNGLISRIHRQTSASAESGFVNESIQVTGLDLGKILTKWEIYYNPYADGVEGIIKGLAIFDEILPGLRPEEALQGLLDVVLNNTNSPFLERIRERGEDQPFLVFVDLKNKNAPKMFELLQLHSTISKKNKTDSYNIVTFEGALWNAFKRWSNEPWNELFVDNGHPSNEGDDTLRTDADTTFIYLREAPYIKERFNALVTHDLDYGDILGSFIVSKGDDDTYTYYFANPIYYLPLSALDAKAMGAFKLVGEDTTRSDGTPAISLANRFGFRPLDLQSVHLSFGRSNDEDKKGLEDALEAEKDENGKPLNVFTVQEELSQELLDFYDPNPEFLTGSITIKPNRLVRTGNGEGTLTKIGQRIRITNNPKNRPNEIYYVTGVTNSWTFGNRFVQNLNLHRGIIENRDV